ncbi:Branched-chain amino acid transport system permease protein OS=Castellaniella defragrans OX=75697 GN=HNR28_002067 PE=3 SV=1 [Castellaniella defragrans]
MNSLIPLVLDTLSSAALIYFAAVGLTLVFNILRVLNVAHGSFYAIGAYLAAALCSFIISSHLNPYLSYVALLLSAIIAAVVLGPLIERTVVRWTYGRSEAVQILITFGLFLILEDLQRMVFGVQSFYEDTAVRLMGSTTIGHTIYLNYQIFLIAIAVLVVIGLRIFTRRSRLGRLITAVVADREMAQCIGVDTNKLFVLAFSFGVFLAALGGALALPTTGVAPGLGADTTVLAFAVAAIGGLGQVEGAAIAALIVALARVLAIYFVPALDAVAPYAAMLIVLLIQPYGLFGSHTARRI